MRRLGVGLLLALALVPSAGGQATATRVYLGVKGDAARFKELTGQESVVRHAFLGWGQGLSWGSRFRTLVPEHAPVPMFHLGTRDANRREVVTPRDVATGRGDPYLFALNQAVAEWGRLFYVRPYAEMNNYANAYSAVRADGKPKDKNHTAQWYKQMFRRTSLILRGGSAAEVSRKLKALGLPGISQDLAVNPPSRLRIIWNPMGYGRPDTPSNRAAVFYPGDAYVDVVGNDLYDQNFKAEWEAAERLYRSHPRKPYAFPEWGLWAVDDPPFVRRMCEWIRTHPRTELAAYFNGDPGSVFDLASKPKSRAEYRRCLTPLGRPAPGGAGGAPARGTPPTPATLLRIAASPSEGAAPLEVTFDLESNVERPAQWQVVFGDGKVQVGQGAPPASVTHTYERDGVYEAVLIVYQAPPFVGTAIRFLTRAKVEVGDEPGTPLALRPSVASGKAPLAVSFRTIVNLERVMRWQFLPGDGSSREGAGKPPRFLGFTYKAKGAYRAILIVYLAPQFQGTATRLLTFADVRAS